MPEDNFSIFCIPKFEIITIKDDDFYFSEDYSKGAIGTSVAIREIMNYFNKNQIAATIYLYGLGVISNEKSTNFNFPSNRPDLIICSGAIKPKLLIDVKYHEYNSFDDCSFDEFIDRLTYGKKQIILCNVENFEGYLEESKKIRCPIYILSVFRINYKDKFTHTLLCTKLTEELRKDLEILETGKPKRKAYHIKKDKMMNEVEFFKEISEHFKK